MRVCAFIGHSTVKEIEKVAFAIENTVENLIASGVTEFLFGSKSKFDELCLKIITDLRKKYPQLVRVYVRAEYEYISTEYEEYLLKFYDKSYFALAAHNAGRLSYIKRNQEMIDKSDICVFYYNDKLTYKYRSSGTKWAYEYAKRKNKKLINVFEP